MKCEDYNIPVEDYLKMLEKSKKIGGKKMSELMAQYHTAKGTVPRGPTLKFSNREAEKADRKDPPSSSESKSNTEMGTK